MRRSSSLLILLLATSVACHKPAAPNQNGGGALGPTNCGAPPMPDAGVIAQVVAGNTAFAVDLFGQLAASAQGGNVFYSPLSVSTALAMTYAGARSDTATQMAQVLHFPDTTELHEALGANACELQSNGVAPDGGQIDLANAVFGQKGATFEQPFLDTLKDEYGAALQPLDFAGAPEAARKSINGWVSDETRGKIPELLAQGTITPDMKMVLADAVYFEEPWAMSLDSEGLRDFHPSPGQAFQVPMMYGVISAGFAAVIGCVLVELPFAGGNEVMDLLTPEGTDLPTFEASLTADNLESWLGQLTQEQVQLQMPKFHLDSKLDLIPEMQALGLTLPFEASADFSGIDGQRDLSIGLLRHEATLDVGELGATAAAATAVGLAGTSAPQWQEMFTVDAPFVLLIRDVPTGTVLFMGQVTDPRAG